MDYQQYYDQSAPQYQPQTDLINSQIAALPTQQAAQQASLDQAKVNAFRDIGNSANAKGVLFSGFTPDQQAQYVGTKYLPAVANLNTSFNNTKNTLLGSLNNIQAQRSKQAQNDVASYQKNSADQAYKQAQLQLGYARLGASQSRGGITPYQQYQISQQQANQYKATQDASGNYKFVGPGGSPVKLAQYVVGRNGALDANTVLDHLSNGSAYDRKIYNSINTQLANKKISADQNSILNAIARADGGNYYGLR